MPVNELEEHPYLNYHQQFPYPSGHYKGLIVGSFPIYAVTNTINQNVAVPEQRFGQEASMRFFYGSLMSQFWKYTGQAIAGLDPRKENGAYLPPNIAVERCAQMLYDNNFLISDALSRTNRILTSSEDKHLMVQSEDDWVNENIMLNHQIPALLSENEGISAIYFTSTMINAKSPYGWFAQIFGQNLQIVAEHLAFGRVWHRTANITLENGKSRVFDLFFLPTPKTRGIYWNAQRLPMFEAYVQTYHEDFYQEIHNVEVIDHTPLQKTRLSNLREEFLIACYRQALIHSNRAFIGNNLII
ncbi:hypothetical protein [Pedobacter aquatilis]|uniref:hypothetical protein n=1 Tax=Pedobacter aquatilis TaxID=351343 RepID=UPI00292F2DC4|nr:hypothetical protein [Pedobacter aquatilis]